MRSIYIAGPMRGYPEYNFPAFDRAAREWRRAGWRVVNPAELDRVNGMSEFTPLPEDPAEAKKLLREVFSRDLLALLQCDAIALLPGWANSKGAYLEHHLATFLDLEIYDATKPVKG